VPSFGALLPNACGLLTDAEVEPMPPWWSGGRDRSATSRRTRPGIRSPVWATSSAS